MQPCICACCRPQLCCSATPSSDQRAASVASRLRVRLQSTLLVEYANVGFTVPCSSGPALPAMTLARSQTLPFMCALPLQACIAWLCAYTATLQLLSRAFRSELNYLLPLQGAHPGLLIWVSLLQGHSLAPSKTVGAFCIAPLLLPLQERIAQARIASNDEASTSGAHRSRVPVDRSVSTAAEFGQTADRAVIPVVRHQHLSLVDASHHSSVTDLQWLPGMAITGKGRPPTAKVRRTQAAADAGKNCCPHAMQRQPKAPEGWPFAANHGSLATWQRRVERSCSWAPDSSDLQLPRPALTCLRVNSCLRSSSAIRQRQAQAGGNQGAGLQLDAQQAEPRT